MSNQPSTSNHLDAEIRTVVTEIMGLDITTYPKEKKINTITEWDSFNNLMLISRFQDVYNVEFTATEIEATQTIGDLYALLHKRVSHAHGKH